MADNMVERLLGGWSEPTTLEGALASCLGRLRATPPPGGAADAVIDAHCSWVHSRAFRKPGTPVPASPAWATSHPDLIPWLNRVALAKSLVAHVPAIERQPWPAVVKDRCRDEFARMAANVDEPKPDFFNENSIRFWEDMRVSAFKRIDLGACYGEVTGVPRSWILRTGPMTAAAITTYLMREAGGFRPFLDLHVNPNALDEFSADGWDRAWRLAANLVETMPELRGIQCSAWFNDPALGPVSPRLRYLRDRYVDNGGICFRVGGQQHERMLSLVRSPTRRALFAQGRYAPCVYNCVWARRPLLAWAKRMALAPTTNGPRLVVTA